MFHMFKRILNGLRECHYIDIILHRSLNEHDLKNICSVVKRYFILANLYYFWIPKIFL